MNDEHARLNIVVTEDVEERWKVRGDEFIPCAGEVICYLPDSDNEENRYKIGTGITTLNDLPFWYYKNGSLVVDIQLDQLSYEAFSLYIMENDLHPVVNYDDWEIYEIDGRYYYYECAQESDSDEFYEVELVAKLTYNVKNDINIKDGSTLSSLFNCDMCGESEPSDDGDIYYGWFKKIDTKT